MDDLISRKEATEVLMMMQGIVAKEGVRKGISFAWQQIKDLPSAQREHDTGLYVDGYNDGYKDGSNDERSKVIRCKDCEDYQTDWETSAGLHYCAIIDTDMPPEGFCSKATRKGEQP